MPRTRTQRRPKPEVTVHYTKERQQAEAYVREMGWPKDTVQVIVHGPGSWSVIRWNRAGRSTWPKVKS